MQTIEIIGAVVGLLYLYLEYKANRWLWPVGVLMPIVYIWIFFQSKFYADMGVNVYYFFASIYGWIRWNRYSSREEQPAKRSSLSKFLRLTCPTKATEVYRRPSLPRLHICSQKIAMYFTR